MSRTRKKKKGGQKLLGWGISQKQFFETAFLTVNDTKVFKSIFHNLNYCLTHFKKIIDKK